MSITYNEVVKRWKEERNRLALSQEEMGRFVHLTQTNYSKVEKALRRLSFHELKYMCATDIDVHYSFTAQRGNNHYGEFLEGRSYFEVFCYLNIIYSLAAWRGKHDNNASWKAVYEKVKYVPLLEENQFSKNIWMILRHSMGWQQQKMAEALGVDIKKLRDLENGRTLPDSELLCRVYEVFGIPPAVIIKDKKGVVSEISILLERLDEESRLEVCEIFKAIRTKSDV